MTVVGVRSDEEIEAYGEPDEDARDHDVRDAERQLVLGSEPSNGDRGSRYERDRQPFHAAHAEKGAGRDGGQGTKAAKSRHKHGEPGSLRRLRRSRAPCSGAHGEERDPEREREQGLSRRVRSIAVRRGRRPHADRDEQHARLSDDEPVAKRVPLMRPRPLVKTASVARSATGLSPAMTA
jgi:hypothetical protein